VTFLRFPEGCWWGRAASAAHTEGALPDDGRGRNVWDEFFQSRPERFFDGVGPADTSPFQRRRRSDLDLLVETRQTSFRTSIG
jgi:6-phospho-beta-glucosidase